MVNATFKTSSTFLTEIISIESKTVLGTSIRSFLFSSGIRTFLIPALWAANSFSLSPQLVKQGLLK